MNKLYIFLSFVFITQFAFGDFTCDTNVDKYRAIYLPNQYTCNPGYYLPANTDGCVACPNGARCAGGTFYFDQNEFQGITFDNNIPQATMNNICASNFPTRLHAKFEPNQIEIVWQDAAQSDVTANDARYVTYGTDIRTPANPPHIPGKVFTGWKFIPAQ